MKQLKFFLVIALIPLFCVIAQAQTVGEMRDTVRILAIGNSFSEDSVEQNLFEIGAAGGHVLIIGNMYIGGCSLERHVRNLRENIADYAYRKVGTDGVKVNTKETTLETALADEKWDYVSLQQVSQLSGMYETYVETLPELLEYVKSRTGENTKFMFHQTWAYAKDATHNGFVNYDRDQDKMYECIVDASQKAAQLVGIEIIIPTGTAIQNARTSFIGDNMNRDGFHLNLKYGRFTAACTWYEKIFGNILQNSYVPEEMTADYVEVAHLAAYFAVQDPFEVTAINVEKLPEE